MQGGFSEESFSNIKNSKFKDRTGLVPITAKIFNSFEVKPDDTLEYKGVLIGDIVIVGYIIDYKEGEILINLKVWDGTGVVSAQFFNKNESEVHPGLLGFNHDGTRKLVRLFGHAKVFKKDKQFSGNKVLFTDEKDLQLHTFEVIHSWMYLTGKIDENKGKENLVSRSEKNVMNENSNFKQNNNFNSNTGMTNQDSIVFDQIKELSRNNKKVQINEIITKLSSKISKDKVIETVQNLCNSGYLIEEGSLVRII
jgi:hypothetical protein